MQDTVQSILKFWFEEIQPKQWDMVSPAFDFEIKERFSLAYDLGLQGLCDVWQETPEGSLAYALLMGVFPHYMHRGEYKAYNGTDWAVDACNEAINKGYDQIFTAGKRKFFYIALLNSDNKRDLELAASKCRTIKQSEPIALYRAEKALASFRSIMQKNSKPSHAREMAFVDKN